MRNAPNVDWWVHFCNRGLDERELTLQNACKLLLTFSGRFVQNEVPGLLSCCDG